jgi:uncharacterized protein YecT (DUF1311 family)
MGNSLHTGSTWYIADNNLNHTYIYIVESFKFREKAHLIKAQ